mgnify:CR=1 FL=1
MDYSGFVSKAVAQDKRNKFIKYDGELNFIPSEARDFYQNFNPVDVEIGMNGSSVRFYPVLELINLQKEYDYLHVQFVFATCNGDPIFLHQDKIYMCSHGVNTPKWEKLADTWSDFFLHFK